MWGEGVGVQAAHLRAEGHIVELGKGKKASWVKELEKSLQTL